MEIERLTDYPGVARALRIVRDRDADTLSDQLEAVRIPAPTFGEAARAAWVGRRFAALGIEAVRTDAVGNVLARWPGRRSDSPVVLSAHLDTVFPDGTEIQVRREGDRWIAPGIGDNARGLAGMLAVARALAAAGVQTDRPIIFAATVGEEGLGDLRGVKHLFRDGGPLRAAAAFIALDGAGCRRIVTRAVGSRRLRATVTGPGGHSWADAGRGNPIHALAAGLAAIDRLDLPDPRRTVVSTGRMEGGTSVNAIPSTAWAELDLRSESGEALVELEARARDRLTAAVAEANDHRRAGTPAIGLEIAVIGDRPSGATAADAPLVRAAGAATRSLGAEPKIVASSTDANVPIALGVPAITLGAGGESDGAHTVEEWYTNAHGPEGVERVLLITLAAAGPAVGTTGEGGA